MFQTSHRSVVPPCLALLMLIWVPASVRAGSPGVAFDLAQTLPCRDVTSSEFTALHPGERIIEATLPLSMRVCSGDAEAVDEVSIEFATDHDDLQIVDFAPRTELVSHIDGPIEQTTTTEQNHTLSASLGGAIPIPYGSLVAQVAPSASAGTSNQRVATESSKRLPPMHAVVVSGTTNRGRGVFFKFRKTSRRTLEGVHSLSVRFTVPDNWRLGRAKLICSAAGDERILWMEQERTWAKVTLPVVLYEEGDARARGVAEKAVGIANPQTDQGKS